jgi:CHAT domain-containing protein
MDEESRDELLASLRLAEDQGNGEYCICAIADKLDDQAVEAIREESQRTDLGERAAWFEDWYKLAEGGAFINHYLYDFLAAHRDDYAAHKIGVRDYLEERRRLHLDTSSDLLHNASKNLILLLYRFCTDLSTALSNIEANLSRCREIDASQKKWTSTPVPPVFMAMVTDNEKTRVKKEVAEKEREFYDTYNNFVRFILITRDLIQESQNKEDEMKMLNYEGCVALYTGSMLRQLGKNASGKENASPEQYDAWARGVFQQCYASCTDVLEKNEIVNNLAQSWWDEDKQKSLDLHLKGYDELMRAKSDKSIHGRQSTELEERLLDRALKIATLMSELNKYDEAYSFLVPVINDLEAQILSISAPNVVADVLERYGELYVRMVQACNALGKRDVKYNREALEYAEKKNARVFLEALGKSIRTIEDLSDHFASKGLPPDAIETIQKITSIATRHAGAGDPRELIPLIAAHKQTLQEIEYLSENPSDAEALELQALQDKLGYIEEAIWQKTPTKLWWADAVPAKFDDIVAQIPANGILIEYFVTGDAILAFVVDHEGLQDVRKIDFTFRELSEVTDVASLAIQMREHYTGMAALADQGLVFAQTAPGANLEFLYKLLIEPLAGFLVDKRMAYIVPDSKLREIPFHALYRKENEHIKYLIEDIAISYAPSSSILQLLRERRQNVDTCFAAGVPKEKGGPKDAEKEAQMVASLFNTTAHPATKETIGSEAGAYDVIHIACHATPHRASSLFNGLQLEDGQLLQQNVSKVGSSLVTLSACNTYRDDVAGTRAFAGLTGDFLKAGARSVIASLWDTPSHVTYSLMEEFYTHLTTEKNKATALQKAQMKLLEEFPHPFFWAPFFLVGPED